MNFAARAIGSSNGKELYGFDHAVLSVGLPPKKGMWMNLGYWKNTSCFPEACEALLDQVLIAAKLLNEDRTPIGFGAEADSHSAGSFAHEIRLVDVGIGCGDQSLYLTRQCFRTTAGRKISANATLEARSIQPLFDSYVGLTIVQSQADFARDRLSQPDSAIDLKSTSRKTPDVKIFAADAADPALWETKLKLAVSGPSAEEIRKSTKSNTWLLALDTLYHFQPSRDKIFRYAYQDMQASVMAFDLLLSDQATLWERFVLWLMCLFTGIPYGNFVTKEGYRRILTQAGYDSNLIELRDISGYVFSGIADFLRKRDTELSRYGMSVGKFKGPAKAFNWWAESGVVRGVIVVAHRSEKPSTR
ncbi:hypothetical protein BBP40_003435 [Aspergillus hancockii]|nr:hypothetical protein BBP40_003435 [Aspergillus hancockii]